MAWCGLDSAGHFTTPAQASKPDALTKKPLLHGSWYYSRSVGARNDVTAENLHTALANWCFKTLITGQNCPFLQTRDCTMNSLDVFVLCMGASKASRL